MCVLTMYLFLRKVKSHILELYINQIKISRQMLILIFVCCRLFVYGRFVDHAMVTSANTTISFTKTVLFIFEWRH